MVIKSLCIQSVLYIHIAPLTLSMPLLNQIVMKMVTMHSHSLTDMRLTTLLNYVWQNYSESPL